MRPTLALLTLPLAVSALHPLLPRQGTTVVQIPCAQLGQKTCGQACIPLTWTCCPSGAGGCPPTATCQLGANGVYGCCPLGETCVGNGGVNTLATTETVVSTVAETQTVVSTTAGVATTTTTAAAGGVVYTTTSTEVTQETSTAVVVVSYTTSASAVYTTYVPANATTSVVAFPGGAASVRAVGSGGVWAVGALVAGWLVM